MKKTTVVVHTYVGTGKSWCVNAVRCPSYTFRIRYRGFSGGGGVKKALEEEGDRWYSIRLYGICFRDYSAT